MRRRFLFLQGPCTPFFGRLADRLEAAGHEVHRVNFCAGDAWYWGGRVAWHYDAGDMRLVDFLDDKYRRLGITDQILFGDRRPVHRPAVEHAERYGIRTHVFEEGYFRPHWITLEREGVNGHSLLPRDPDWFRETGKALAEPAPAVAFHSPFRVRAFHDVVYHLAGMANPVLYAGYRTHAPVAAPVEYAAYLRRFARLKLTRRREQERVAALIASGRRYFLLPLQLNSDAQIRDHSRFEHMGEVIEHVMESFARHAPADALLVVKNHPLDMGLMNYGRVIRACERRFQLVGRSMYFEGGDLHMLARGAQGVVTVNSTVGMVALELGRPTLTLSDPIYNLPGLTDQGTLDDFWTAGTTPDMAMYACFRRVVMHATQINGAFYCRTGMALAADNSVRVLTAERSPLECLI
jgi:capsular polysaccharide export protein